MLGGGMVGPPDYPIPYSISGSSLQLIATDFPRYLGNPQRQ